MGDYRNIIAAIVIAMITFIYTQVTDLRIAAEVGKINDKNHQDWILRVQNKAEHPSEYFKKGD